MSNNETHKTYALIDLTGAKSKQQGRRRFVMMFVDLERICVNDSRLSHFEVRLLFFLLSRINGDNEVRLSQAEIAKALKKYPTDISKSIKKLRETGYLRTPQIGLIVINPEVAWNGALNANADAVNRWRQVELQNL